MLKFILENWVTVLIVACFTGYALYLAVTKQWEKLRAATYKLILEAEKIITGTKRGQERFDYVFNRVYLLIPTWLQFFVSEESLREKLQEWFTHIKDYMDNGKIDGSNKPPDSHMA